MAVHVEERSRTLGELAGTGIKGLIKWYFILLVVGSFGVGGLTGFLTGLGVPPEPSFFVGVLVTLGILYLLIRRRVRKRRATREAVDAIIAESEDAATEDLPNQGEDAPTDTVVLGRVLDEAYNDSPRVLFLDAPIRNRHCYVLGKTRTGKTSLLLNMIAQDLEQGAGLAFVDPHGDAAERLLGLIPADRTEDLIYFDPTRMEGPSFNPLALPFAPAKLAEDFISVFRMLVGESWGPRLEHLLRFGLLTLLAHKETHTLRDLRRLFVDEDYRAGIAAELDQPQLVEFWEAEYNTIPQSAVNPILNKFSAFLAPMSDLERVFSVPNNDLAFGDILNEGRILIVNLAKGTLGDEPARLLGGMLVSGIQQAALSRGSLPAESRRPFYLYVDEFQNFTVASFDTILAESAKYQLNLTLANQTLSQVGTGLRSAIFGNVGTLVSFQVSSEDAPRIRKEMHRSNVLVRPKGQSDFYRVADFVRYQRGVYTEALSDEYLGMSKQERREFRDIMKGTGGGLDSWRAGSNQGEILAARRAHIHDALRMLEEGADLATLRELFPEHEFREISFPDVDDFLNVPPGYAFTRIGSAAAVAAIRCFPVPEPDPALRAEVEKHLATASRPIEVAESDTPKPPEPPEDFRE